MPFDATGTEVRHDGALGSTRPNDVAVSPDGGLIYAAGDDGNLRIYSADTGQLLRSIDVGNRLGAIDISPDGSFLMAVEMVELATHTVDNNYPTYTVTAYRVDLSTGAVKSFRYDTDSYDYTFHDVAVLDDGTVLFSQNIHPGWSGWATMKLLDLATGEYTQTSEDIQQSSIISAAEDGSFAFVAEYNISDAPLLVYESGVGVVARHGGYADEVSGFNSGIQAFSVEGNLAAQYVPGNGLHIYDAALNYQLNLLDTHPEWQDGTVSALAFDSTGAFLFVLDNAADTIVQLSTADWSVVATFAVGADLISFSEGDYANRLLVGPDLRYFTVVTEDGFLQVDNPAVSSTVTGTSAADDITATGMFDEIIGGAGNDILNALGGDDIVSGGTGNDRMYGGTGNDTYVVDNAEDRAVENLSAGNDLVRSSVGFALGANVERLTLTGANAINAFGNGLDNVLLGNSAANVLSGGAGADSMRGGGGNDTYVIDNTGDLAIEGSATGGTDLVKSSVSFTLGAYVEKLTLTGSNAINGVGNGMHNVINGNGASNILKGGHGNDTIRGGAGGDKLVGAAGNDSLTGGNGADLFLFKAALSASTNVDRITDFSRADDIMQLDDDVFAAIGPIGALSAAAFRAGTSAADADDRIIYDSATGRIYYDVDGNGAGSQVLFAQVTAGLVLTNADFQIVG